jgi:uncharacterized membrane protein SpoIIM required for sporulation
MTITSIFKNNAGLFAAGAAGIAIISYAVYFDRQRRSTPNYKESIRRSIYLFMYLFI